MKFKRSNVRGCVVWFRNILICISASLSIGHAAIIADFSGGDGTSQPDQYRGIAGDGWSGPWGFRSGSDGTTAIGVQSSNPFPGGGNYLQVQFTKTSAGGGSNRAGVARQFLTTGEDSVSTLQAYTISFDFRADSLTGWGQSGDQIAFSSETTTTIGAFGVSAPWSLLIRGDTGWVVTDGNGVGGVTNLNFSSLGLTSLTPNTVYSIGVFIDPANNGYDLTITTGGTTYRASELNNNELLGFRTNADAAAANVLQFRTLAEGASDAVTFSLDNIAVVPEPSTAAFLFPVMIGMGLIFRSRRISK